MTAIFAFGALLAALVTYAAPASAQETPGSAPVEEEEVGTSRGGYAWGEAPPEEGGGGESGPVYRRYGTAFANLGFGGTIRMLVYASQCPTEDTCRFAPPYLHLAGGYMFETDSILQHGVGLGVATNLSGEGSTTEGVDAGGQWVLTPRYYARVWLDDWFQIRGSFGVPLAISALTTGFGESAGTAFNWGLELQADVIFKFLTGLGVYLGVNVATWFGSDEFPVWPTLSIEGGLVFDYEVLP